MNRLLLLLLLLLTNADNRNCFQYWIFFNAYFCLSKCSSGDTFNVCIVVPLEIRDQFSIRKMLKSRIQTKAYYWCHCKQAVECEFIFYFISPLILDHLINSILLSVWQPVHFYCYLLFSMFRFYEADQIRHTLDSKEEKKRRSKKSRFKSDKSVFVYRLNISYRPFVAYIIKSKTSHVFPWGDKQTWVKRKPK